jgi:hypothetical protein
VSTMAIDYNDLAAATSVDDLPAVAKIIDKMDQYELIEFKYRCNLWLVIAEKTFKVKEDERKKLLHPFHD